MSGSQKFVFVVSILDIIGAIIAIIAGIAAFIAGAATINSNNTVGFTALIAGPIIFFGGLLALISGIIGIRAARDATKAGLFYFISLFSLIINVLSFIGAVRSNGFQASDLVSLVMPVLMFIAARNIRNEGRYQ